MPRAYCYLCFGLLVITLPRHLTWNQDAGASLLNESITRLNNLSSLLSNVVFYSYHIILSSPIQVLLHSSPLQPFLLSFYARSCAATVFVYFRKHTDKKLSLRLQFLPLPRSLITSLWFSLSYLSISLFLSFLVQFQLVLNLSDLLHSCTHLFTHFRTGMSGIES